MDADSDRSETDDPDEAWPDVVSDGGTATGFDEARLHAVVRDAVEDAILGAIGTLLLVGIAFVLVVAGGQLLLASISPWGTAFGIGLLAVGTYIAAATLRVIPPVREWV